MPADKNHRAYAVQVADTYEVSNVFEDPKVSEMWMNVTDMTGDPTIAKEVIGYLCAEMWNLPWGTWKALHDEVSE